MGNVPTIVGKHVNKRKKENASRQNLKDFLNKEDAKNAISFEEYRRRVGGKTNLDAMFGYVEEETKEQDNK